MYDTERKLYGLFVSIGPSAVFALLWFGLFFSCLIFILKQIF